MRNKILIIILFTSSLLLSQEKSNFDIKTLLSLKRASEPVLSPDGTILLFNIVTPDVETNKKSNHLYFINTNLKGTTTKLSKDNFNEMNAVWSSDNKKIAYLGINNGDPQIRLGSFLATGFSSKQVSAVNGGVNSFQWAPNEKFFVFASEVKTTQSINDKYPKLDKADVVAYDNLPVRHWDSFEDNKRSHLFILNTEDGKYYDIMENEQFDCPLMPFGGASDYAISSDSKEIAYTSRKTGNEHLNTNSDIFLYDIETKKTINITKANIGYDKEPKYSPNGRYIAYKSQERDGLESDKIRIMVYDRVEKNTWEATSRLDQWVNDFVWASDNTTIYFTATYHGTEPLYSVNIQTKLISKLSDEQADYGNGITINNNSSMIVVGRTTMQDPTDYFAFTPQTKKFERLTNINKEVMDKLNRIKIDEIWTNTKDGKKVHSWVAYPPNFDVNKKYPLITYCQGGPQSAVSHYWSYRWNIYLMASQGYIVVGPNRRGAPGFGQDWVDAISKDWGGKAMQDILDATDDVSKNSYVDKNRLAAVGASAGGFTTFWLAGNHEGRFSALVSHCGVFNFESMYGSTEELFFANSEFGGPYWDEKNKDFYEKNSPNKFVKKWKTPMLIYAGQKDYRVPYNQSLEAYTALKTQNIPGRLIVFPNENHWVLGLQNSFIWHSEFFEFLDKYCKSKVN